MVDGGFGLILLLFMAGLGLVITLAVLSAKRAKARRAELASWAAQNSLGYREEDPRWIDQFASAPFGQGHNRSAQNVITGKRGGREVAAFDYRYYTTETSTDSEGRTTHREVPHPHAVVAMQTGVVFPQLSVTPEGFFSRVAGRLTSRDIELESEDFNRAFTVTSPDRKFASDVLHPATMEFLLTHPEHAFRFEGPWVLTIRPGKYDVAEIAERLDYVQRVIDQIPEFIWKDVHGS